MRPSVIHTAWRKDTEAASALAACDSEYLKRAFIFEVFEIEILNFKSDDEIRKQRLNLIFLLKLQDMLLLHVNIAEMEIIQLYCYKWPFFIYIK